MDNDDDDDDDNEDDDDDDGDDDVHLYSAWFINLNAQCAYVCQTTIIFVVQLNDSFNFPLELIKYTVIIVIVIIV